MSASSNDRLIETAYHGAAGAAAFSQHKYDEAISHLEEDKNNPLSLKLLAAGLPKDRLQRGSQAHQRNAGELERSFAGAGAGGSSVPQVLRGPIVQREREGSFVEEIALRWRLLVVGQFYGEGYSDSAP